MRGCDDLTAVVADPGQQFVDRLGDRVTGAADQNHDRVWVGLDALDQVGVQCEGWPIEPGQDDHVTYSVRDCACRRHAGSVLEWPESVANVPFGQRIPDLRKQEARDG